MPLFGPPMHVVPEQGGHGWMPAIVDEGSVAVSPVRKRSEVSGRLTVVAPVSQVSVPLTGADAAFSTQTLVGVLPGLGTASGAPKRQPVLVHVRLLPVSVDVAPPREAVWPAQLAMALMAVPWSGTANGRGTALPPPPEKRPAQASWAATMPVLSMMSPQSPGASLVT